MFALPLMMSGVAGVADHTAAVSTMLSGSKGHVWDFTDIAVMWRDHTKTLPVTTPTTHNIGAINSKYGSTVYTLTETTDSLRGFWNGNAWEGEGADDRLIAGTINTLQDVSAATLVAYVRFDSITSQPVILAFSTTSGTTHRFVVDVLSTGAIRILCRRLDGDAVNTLSSATGTIVAGNTYCVHAEVDYATGAAKIWVNDTLVVNTTIAGTVGNTSNTVSARMRMSLALSNTLTQRLDGAITRMIVATKILSAGETISARGYVKKFLP